ncbi:hypothetical protein Cgig2_012989 [Carnegiea gigantea]|uniref:Uncharacterized protein n=1 Tax=Carnegiea gigantea TaxID=171969 RepID=A0A9Q1K9V4_9CARY|nr:hypothetical protein Cgig2_012989 [Carnegiea gigantea]
MKRQFGFREELKGPETACKRGPRQRDKGSRFEIRILVSDYESEEGGRSCKLCRPLPRFEYVPTAGCEPLQRRNPAAFPYRNERVQEASHVDGDRRLRGENWGHSTKANAYRNYRLGHEHPARSTTASTLLEEGSSNNDGSPSVVLTVSVPEASFGKGTATQGLWFLRKESEPARPEPRDEECSTEIVATIGGRYAEDITREKNWEVDFLVVDVPTAYHIILGRPTLHKVKVVITSYLLQLQFEDDDGSVGMMQGDQCIARTSANIPPPPKKRGEQNPKSSKCPSLHCGHCPRWPQLCRLQGQGSRPCNLEAQFPHPPGLP